MLFKKHLFWESSCEWSLLLSEWCRFRLLNVFWFKSNQALSQKIRTCFVFKTVINPLVAQAFLVPFKCIKICISILLKQCFISKCNRKIDTCNASHYSLVSTENILNTLTKTKKLLNIFAPPNLDLLLFFNSPAFLV